MIRHILIATAAIGLVQTAAAQSQPTPQPVQNRNYGTYSMANGFQPAPPVSQRYGPAVLWDNWNGDESFYMNSAVNQTFGIDDEMVDQLAMQRAGTLPTVQVNGITFDYCSSVPDPGTNNVLPVNLRIYQDYQDINSGSMSPTGWPIASCEYMMMLPGGNSTGTVPYCWTIGLDMRLGLECTVPTEQTVGGMEPIGAGWTYGDPRPSPFGDSGPIVDNITTHPPGYGAIDEMRMHDRNTSSFVGQIFGNGSTFFLSQVSTWEGMPPDTEAYYHTNPLTQQPDPRPADTLWLTPDARLTPGTFVNFSVGDPDPLMSYTLVVSNAQADIARLLTAPAQPVEATQLIDVNPHIPPIVQPIPMPAGWTGPAWIPVNTTMASILFQAVEHTGAGGLSGITAVSNGVKATIQ